jgi:hypothetical protein
MSKETNQRIEFTRTDGAHGIGARHATQEEANDLARALYRLDHIATVTVIDETD